MASMHGAAVILRQASMKEEARLGQAGVTEGSNPGNPPTTKDCYQKRTECRRWVRWVLRFANSRGLRVAVELPCRSQYSLSHRANLEEPTTRRADGEIRKIEPDGGLACFRPAWVTSPISRARRSPLRFRFTVVRFPHPPAVPCAYEKQPDAGKKWLAIAGAGSTESPLQAVLGDQRLSCCLRASAGVPMRSDFFLVSGTSGVVQRASSTGLG